MTNLNKAGSYLLTIVRMAIGWQFLYEGIAKIIAGNWTSAPYLAGSRWILAPLFTAMADNQAAVAFVDFINIWGMVLVGVGLMLGLLSRWASAGGALMLLLYFIAYPPIPGYMTGVPTEGSYLWVNRNLIEL
ncbi:MAG: DoxX subfamily, partial [Bacteroidales bacterium]